MSDEKLRSLEKKWQATGTPEDEAALLLERVRLGRLSKKRLEVAALLCLGGARLAEGSKAALPKDKEELQRWGHALVDLGRTAAFRVTLSAAEAALSKVWASPPAVVDEVQASLHAYRDCSVSADMEALKHVRPKLHGVVRGSKREQKRQRSALDALSFAAVVAEVGGRWTRHTTLFALSYSSSLVEPSELAQHVAHELLPWVLSSAEPLEPDSAPAEFLVKVKETFGITGRGTILQPDVTLSPGYAELQFRVELRRPDGSVESCIAKASIPRRAPGASRGDYVLLVPLEKDQVPIGTEVWEVGP